MDRRQGDSTEATSDRVISWAQLLELDDMGAGSGVEVLERLGSQVHEGDLATIIYTSGTTGPPKGVMLTHGSIYAVVESATTVLPVGPDDIGIAFLPMAHSLQRIASYGCSWKGVPGAIATSIDALPEEIREIRPTVQASVPRIWEKFHARIQGSLDQAPGWKQRLFQ
jgi:long-chain acyl-CoA synthetase